MVICSGIPANAVRKSLALFVDVHGIRLLLAPREIATGRLTDTRADLRTGLRRTIAFSGAAVIETADRLFQP